MKSIKIHKITYFSSPIVLISISFLGMALFFIFQKSGIFSIVLSLLFFILALISFFIRDVVEIDFENNTLWIYIQLLVFKLGKKRKLPELEYLLVRSFNTKKDYENIVESLYIYEISYVTKDNKKIVLTTSQSKRKIRKLVKNLNELHPILTIDKTKDNIL